MRPFLKWAGGKYRLVDRIVEALPPGKRLVEPFVGSGAVFVNTEYEGYVLSDSNSDLISLFQILKKERKQFISYCQEFFTSLNNAPEVFYEFRRSFNTTKDLTKKAALFVYLNRHCFNGLCRYNSKHEFNTPFGRYERPHFPLEEMRHFLSKAKRATFICQDFEKTMNACKAGDVVYCDPPYVPLSQTANFTSYDSDGFDLAEQVRLARVAERISAKGIPVVISNHDTSFTQKEYSKARLVSFDVQRFISCKGSKRGTAGELLAVFI